MSDQARALVRELSDRLKASTDTLAHYSSPYYDPAKAHEYYERTKKLKGGGSASASLSKPSDSGFTKAKLTGAKDKDLDAIKAERDEKLTALRTKAEAKSQAIQAKLADAIAKKADAILKRMENLPEDADPDLVKKLMASHSKNANKARQQAHKEMASVMTSIRSAIASTKQNYSANREAINSQYAKKPTPKTK